jgi:hypothetical protein
MASFKGRMDAATKTESKRIIDGFFFIEFVS